MDIVIGGAVTCKVDADEVKGNTVTDLSQQIKIKPVCEMAGQLFPVAVGLDKTTGTTTITSTANGATVNNHTDDLSLTWDDAANTKELGHTVNDTIFGSAYVVMDPAKGTNEVTATVQNMTAGSNLPVGEWEIPLVVAMYAN